MIPRTGCSWRSTLAATRAQHPLRLVARGADPEGDRGGRVRLRAGPLSPALGPGQPKGRDPPRGRPHRSAIHRGAQPVLHGPGSIRAGSRDGNLAIEGLISYAAEVGASRVVYHAANLPDEPASEDARLAETRALAALATIAERLGVIIALENLAPVYPSPDALSFTPMILRTMAKRISSPAVGLCIDIGHANIVARLRRTDPMDLIEPVLDRVVLFHLHDNLGARRGVEPSPELDPLRLDLHLPPAAATFLGSPRAPVRAQGRGAAGAEVHRLGPRRRACSRRRSNAVAPHGGSRRGLGLPVTGYSANWSPSR